MAQDIYNNFWLADDGRVFASARQLIVGTTDPGYVAWSSANVATKWPRDLAGNQTNPALQAVLTPYNLYVDLVAYAANARYARTSGGITVTSIAPGKLFMTDQISRNDINRAYDYALANGGATFQWKMADGSFVLLNKTQMTTLNNDLTGFITACFTCEKNTQSSIAGGAITTQAQIDSAFAAISNVFP